MKKQDDGNATLKWRLSQAPTYEQVMDLLDAEVITSDEAKQILFSEVNSADQTKALDEQVTFLKDIIDRLSKQPPQQVWTYVNAYQPRNPWNGVGIGYSSPAILCSAVGNIAQGSSSSNGIVTYSTTTIGTNLMHPKGSIHTK